MRNAFKYAVCAAVGFAVCGAMAGSSASAQEAITVTSGGGAYSNSQIEAYHKPFTEKTGVVVHADDYNYELGPIRAQVEAGNVTWDVVDVELEDAVRGCEDNLLEPIDLSVLPPAPDGTPAKEDFIESALQECGVGTIVWSLVYAYDYTKFPGEKPSTIKDFFEVEKFPGKRGMGKRPRGNLEWALVADGVPIDQVYDVLATPEGVNRAFAKLDTIKDHVLWWEAGAQPPQLLADGEVAMTTAWNGRLYNAIVIEEKPFAIVWDGQIWDIDLYAIVKGSKNYDTALEFIKFATDTQRLADQTKYIAYGPVRKSSLPLVAEDMLPHMPTAPENFENALRNDYQFWADHQDELIERFNAWLAK